MLLHVVSKADSIIDELSDGTAVLFADDASWDIFFPAIQQN